MVEHTPGPWVATDNGSAVKVDRESKFQMIASIYGDDPECQPDERMRANAALIAAAPMMLDALAKVYNALMSDPPHGPQKHVGPDDVIYCLDGQLMYHAINAARDALALVRASTRERSNDGLPNTGSTHRE